MRIYRSRVTQEVASFYTEIMRGVPMLVLLYYIVLPALGNEFIAILKDSALVSALGVQDITQLGKVYSASTFKFFETYNIVAFLYLVMTMGLAALIRFLEQRLD